MAVRNARKGVAAGRTSGFVGAVLHQPVDVGLHGVVVALWERAGQQDIAFLQEALLWVVSGRGGGGGELSEVRACLLVGTGASQVRTCVSA